MKKLSELALALVTKHSDAAFNHVPGAAEKSALAQRVAKRVGASYAQIVDAIHVDTRDEVEKAQIIINRRHKL